MRPRQTEDIPVLEIANSLLSKAGFLQTFPTRTEGSVKKHWYKVCAFNTVSQFGLSLIVTGHALC